jgi:hypothetical protein
MKNIIDENFTLSKATGAEMKYLTECGQQFYDYIQELKQGKGEPFEEGARKKILSEYDGFEPAELGLIFFNIMVDREVDTNKAPYKRRERKLNVFDNSYNNGVEYFKNCVKMNVSGLQVLNEQQGIDTLAKITAYNILEGGMRYGFSTQHPEVLKFGAANVEKLFKELFDTDMKFEKASILVEEEKFIEYDELEGRGTKRPYFFIYVTLDHNSTSAKDFANQLKKRYLKTIAEIKANATTTLEQKEKATLHAIFEFVCWTQNFHFFENGNGRLSLVNLNKLLIENNLPLCALKNQAAFCLEYPILSAIYKKRGENPDKALDMYYEGAQYYQQMKQNIIEDRGNLKTSSSEPKLELNTTQPSNPLNLNPVKPFSKDGITMENSGLNPENVTHSKFSSDKNLNKPDNESPSNQNSQKELNKSLLCSIL